MNKETIFSNFKLRLSCVNSMGKLFLVTLILLVQHILFSCTSSNDLVPFKKEEAVDQLDYSTVSCGPASILNSFRFGNPERLKFYNSLKGDSGLDKLKNLIEKYFQGKSDYYKSSDVIDEEGVRSLDLLKRTNNILEGSGIREVNGCYLDRQPQETGRHFVKRIARMLKGSLDKGVPIIAVVAAYSTKNEREKMGWERVGGHFVVIRSIKIDPSKEVLSFDCNYIDPEGGCIRRAFVFAEERRPYGAWKYLGDDKNEWLSNNPFLLFTAPFLDIGIKQKKWHHRTQLLLTYAIGDFDED